MRRTSTTIIRSLAIGLLLVPGLALATLSAVTTAAGATTSTSSSTSSSSSSTTTAAPNTPSIAASLVVTNVTDCATAGCGSLRAAITAADASANAAADAPIITFADGLSGTIMLTSDLPTITRSMTITGPGPQTITIHGVSQHRAFTATGAASDMVTITGLEIMDCLGADGQGGAIGATGVSLTLRGDYIEFSTAGTPSSAQGTGGGVLVNSSGSVVIEDSILNSNVATGNGNNSYGGSLSIQSARITIRNTSIANSNSQFDGGLIISGSESVIVDGVTVSGNAADMSQGAGVISGNDVSVTWSRFTDNQSAVGLAGVGIIAQNLTIDSVRIDHNGAAASATPDIGGALIGASTGTVSRLTVDHNVGAFVGGSIVRGGLTMTDATVADNTGAGLELGSYAPVELGPTSLEPAALVPQMAAPNGIVHLDHVTVVRNTGNGIEVGLTGCINSTENSLAACSLDGAGTGPSTSIPIAPMVLDHVLAHDNTKDVVGLATATWSMIGTHDANVTISTGTITTGDPQVEALYCDGDIICVAPIPTTSVAWNAGNPSFTPPPDTDQLGQPRVVDVIDIGAYENQTPIAAPVVNPVFAG